MSRPSSIQCPFCQSHYVLILDKSYKQHEIGMLDNVSGTTRLILEESVCQNPQCHKTSLTGTLTQGTYTALNRNVVWQVTNRIGTWRLLPDSMAKPQPDYIPAPLRADYTEACKIRDLSPKASATLSRRCLQGMIRDFWGISKRTLKAEIDALKDEPKLDLLTWQAIDGTRRIGNIGAHMEADINLIVDVEPNEAQILIDLIEMLFKDWYISRYQREQQLQALLGVAAAKDSERSK